jgi:hypothetical protein
VLAAQGVVGHAKTTAGEQILPIHVVGKGAGLADQRVDDVPVIDGMLAASRQPWHALDEDARMPYLHFLDANHHVHLAADQAAMHRVRVPLDLDRAASSHRNVSQPSAAFQPACRKWANCRQLLGKPVLPVDITGGHQVAEESQVFLPAGKVAAATQPQGLIHRLLEMPVRGFRIAVLMRLTDIDPLSLQTVVLQQVSIPLMKFTLVGKVVHRRRETIAAMPPGTSSQFPEGILQALAQRLEGFRRAERDRFPIGISQREVVHQVGERLASEGHPQGIHVREIRSSQVTGVVDLSEHHRLVRSLRRSPGADLPLESTPLTVGILRWIFVLKPAKQGNRL